MALGTAVDGPSRFHDIQNLCLGGSLSLGDLIRLHIHFLPSTSAMMLLSALACAQRIAFPAPLAIRIGLRAGITVVGFTLMTLAMIAGQALAGRLAPGLPWLSAMGAFAGMAAILPLPRLLTNWPAHERHSVPISANP